MAPLNGLLARNTAASWANYLFAGVASLLLTPLVVRALGAPRYGVWVLLLQLAAYGSMLELGLQAALTKQVARARAAGDSKRLSAYVAAALSFYSVAALTILVLARWGGSRLASSFNLAAVEPESAGETLFILAAATSCAVVAAAFTATLKGCLRFDQLAVVSILSHIVRVLAVVVAIAQRGDIQGLAWATLLSNSIVLIGTACLAVREVRRMGPLAPAFSGAALAELLGFGLFNVASLSGWYLTYATDLMIVGRFLPPQNVAQLGLALSVSAMVSGAIGAFAQTFMPIASSLEASGESLRLRRVYLLGSRWCLLLAVPSFLLALGWGPEIISIWVGRDLGAPAGMLLSLLLLAQLPGTANSVGFQIGLGTGLHRQAGVLSLAEGVTKVALSLALVGPLGVPGVLLASFVAGVVFQAVAWPVLLARRLGLAGRDFAQLVFLPLVRPLVLASFAGVAGEVLLGMAGVPIPFLPPALATVTYLLAAYNANREQLEALVQKGRSPLHQASQNPTEPLQ
jgi:O-antigen/teichoic acid export membrane protein